jgi:hypothetical protein
VRRSDVVLVQYDQKQHDSARYTEPHTGYRANLRRYVAEARAEAPTWCC